MAADRENWALLGIIGLVVCVAPPVLFLFWSLLSSIWEFVRKIASC